MRSSLATLLLLAALAGSVAVPHGARAQQPVPSRDSARRDTMRRAPARSDTTVTRLPTVEVRASIAPSAGASVGSGIPARISTLTTREIDAWAPRTLADALGSQPGVSTYDDLGTPYKLSVSARGFSVGPTVGLPPGITVFLDGVRQNEPDAQEVNFDLLPMENVERVEVLSGAASLLGPNSLAGAINLITRRGGTPSTALQLSGGSFGAYAAQASTSGTTDDAWDYYASAGVEREHGWRQATGDRNYNALLNVGRSRGSRTVHVQILGARSRAETAGSLPESIFTAAPQRNFTAGDFEDVSTVQGALSAETPVGSGRGVFSAYLRRAHAERFNVNQPPDDDVRSVTTSYTLGGRFDWRWVTAAGAGAVALRTGVDGSANRVHVRIRAEPQGASDGADSLTTNVRSPSWDIAAYALADYHVGRVTLSAGARYDVVRIPFRNLLDRAGDTASTFRSFNPRGGVSVEVASGASLYASVGRSFRAPAILELACADPDATCPLPFALGDDPPLDPVRATTYEIGARWTRGPATVVASAYHTNVRDEIFFVASERALLSGFFTNVPRTRRDGADVSVQLALGQRVLAYASYAWTRATFRSAAELFSIRSDEEFASSPLAGSNSVQVGDRLPLVPEHQIKTGALLRLPAAFAIGLDTRYVGRQWFRGDEANETQPLAPYLLANARVAWSGGGWEITLRTTNVLDSHRAIFGTFNENRESGELERFLTPMNARTVKLELRRQIAGGEGGA
ncbi:MAG TPA: TonB-dependent receptor [Gemmatimonadaceae bacterium]|nr:TonB-dependent receptor [Gemmatimonadaceae bacterium]